MTHEEIARQFKAQVKTLVESIVFSQDFMVRVYELLKQPDVATTAAHYCNEESMSKRRKVLMGLLTETPYIWVNSVEETMDRLITLLKEFRDGQNKS